MPMTYLHEKLVLASSLANLVLIFLYPNPNKLKMQMRKKKPKNLE
jgi:hypothetical protein